MTERIGDVSVYKKSYQSALAGIAIADLQGELRQVNPAFLEMWGYDDEEEVVGRSVTEFWVDPESAASVAATVIEGEEWEGELRAVRKDGSEFDARVNASSLTDEKGDPVYIMSSFVDISDRVAREHELARKNEQLEQFASVVSHDLRNPLNVVDGRIELAQLEQESEHFLEARDALDRAQKILDDVLSLAREGVRVDEVEMVELPSKVQECWRHVPSAEAELVNETSRTLPADESRLKQLLENLFLNAVQHGGDEVTVTIGDVENGFYVADDGVGIPPDIREQVFEAGVSTAPEGTGFGLNIVEQLADAHGWSVDVTESEGGGARFEVTGVESAPE